MRDTVKITQVTPYYNVYVILSFQDSNQAMLLAYMTCLLRSVYMQNKDKTAWKRKSGIPNIVTKGKQYNILRMFMNYWDIKGIWGYICVATYWGCAIIGLYLMACFRFFTWLTWWKMTAEKRRLRTLVEPYLSWWLSFVKVLFLHHPMSQFSVQLVPEERMKTREGERLAEGSACDLLI